MRARSVNFERGKDPKSSIGIGKNRFGKSKMGENSGYEVIWSDGNWNIEKYLNPNTGKYSIVVVGHDDGEDPDDVWDQTEYPILYDDGRVGYDNPYIIPNYVRDIVRELYPSIRESLSFQRGRDPKRALGIGIIARLEDLAKLLEDELHWNGASVEVQDDGSLLYLCMAGNSVIGDIKEVIEKFGWGKMMKVNIADDCSRNYPDCEFHTYKISFKAPLRRKYGLSESLDFERGQDPLKTMDIGILNKKKHFNNVSEAMEWVADVIPIILGKPEMPSDIAFSSGLIKGEYILKISDYVAEKISWENQNGNWWDDELIDILQNRGFVNESLSFERGKDPKKSLDIGLANKAFPIIDIFPSPYSTIGEYLKKILDTTGFITPHHSIQVIRDPDFKGAISATWDLQDLEGRGYTGIKYKGLFVPFEKYVTK